jgi:NAD(P)-dependent dehydrogenase (short-subunit alcohol dehydrogenase family)
VSPKGDGDGDSAPEPLAQSTLISRSIPRVALVTGGAKRVGLAIVLALAEAGFAVAVHCRDDGDEAATAVRARGAPSAILRADLRDEATVSALVAQAEAELGPVGVLVNNASRFERDEWDTTTRESWDAHLEPNLRAPFVLTQHFARSLPAAAEGVVINMLDQRVWSLTPHFVSYTVSKAGLWALTQSMALALAPRIRVNAIGPGPTLPSPRQSQAQFARQCAAVPLQRGSTPDEVARAVLAILALPSLTGQMLALDGGQHMQWHPAPLPMSEPEE